MVRRREWEEGPAAAKSRAFAGTITMETEDGRRDPAPHFLGLKSVFFGPKESPHENYKSQRPLDLCLLRKGRLLRGSLGVVVLRMRCAI